MSKRTEKHKAFILFASGGTQKQTARKVGVTEKTCGKWAKEWREQQHATVLTAELCRKKLNNLLTDPTAKTADIKNLTQSLKDLETLKQPQSTL